MKTHRSRAWVSSVFILIVIALVITLVPHKKVEAPTNTSISSTTPPTLEQKMTVVTKAIKQENKQLNYIINISYPQLENLTKSDAQIKINKSIAARVQAVIKDFGSANNPARGEPLPGSEPSTLDVTYSIQSNTTIPNIVSIRLIESFFEAGAAHPGHYIDTLNYNTTTGAEISLSDIFSSSDYLNRLSSSTRLFLQKKIGNNLDLYPQVSSGTEAVPENFETFILADTGIIIIFQEYQVAAYAAGVQEVLVPYSEIKDILDPKGPLEFLFIR